jgi:hypothetical protein
MRTAASNIRYPNDIFTRQCHSSCILSPTLGSFSYLKWYGLVGRRLFYAVDGTKRVTRSYLLRQIMDWVAFVRAEVILVLCINLDLDQPSSDVGGAAPHKR